MVNDAKFIATDVVVSNGVIHAVDQVLLPVELSKAEKAMAVIKAAVERGVQQYNDGDATACVQIYELCIISVINLASDELTAATLNDLKAVLKRDGKISDSQYAWKTRKALDRLYAELSKSCDKKELQERAAIKGNDNSFKVRLEAPMPEGFPQPGPVDKIVYKSYPTYRSAKMSNTNSKNISFMRLFGHIKKNKISMTAPVIMDLNENAQRQTMAFLYANQSLGSVGQKGDIEVGDRKAQEYISIGMRGRETQELINSAVTKLRRSLTDQDKYKAIGVPRLLGYNSPMVPSEKRFWEVQIPVEKIVQNKQTTKL